MLANLNRHFFPASFCAMVISLVTASSAHAISLTISWQGNGGNTVTGTLTGTDTDGNGIIDGTFSKNEWTTDSSFTFTDNVTPASPITYTIGQLLSFGAYYGGSNGFRFNYNLSSLTASYGIGTIEQLGDPNTGVGLSIGDINSGYILESSSLTGLQFTDNVSGTFSGNDSGGTLTSQPIPFDFNPATGMIALGVLFGAKQAWQKFKPKKDIG